MKSIYITLHVQGMFLKKFCIKIYSTWMGKWLCRIYLQPLANMCLGHEKRNPVFMGGQTFQVGLVGGAFFFFDILFFSGGKNDSPKNTRLQKIWRFLEKNCWKNILSYFQKLSAKFSLTLAKKLLILHDFSTLKNEKKKKENLIKWKIWVGRACKTGFPFLWPFEAFWKCFYEDDIC